MTCTRTKSKYVRKDAQHECHGGAPPAPAPTPATPASVPSPTPVELYLRPVNATGHKSQPAVEPEIAVQLPKQLPGLRRPNSNFPFSILLPPPSPCLSFFLSFFCLSCLPYTIPFMILLHLRILRCRCRCRCPTDLWTERTLSLPAPSAAALLRMEIWKSGVFKTLKQRTKRP